MKKQSVSSVIDSRYESNDHTNPLCNEGFSGVLIFVALISEF